MRDSKRRKSATSHNRSSQGLQSLRIENAGGDAAPVKDKQVAKIAKRGRWDHKNQQSNKSLKEAKQGQWKPPIVYSQNQRIFYQYRPTPKIRAAGHVRAKKVCHPFLQALSSTRRRQTNRKNEPCLLQCERKLGAAESCESTLGAARVSKR